MTEIMSTDEILTGSQIQTLRLIKEQKLGWRKVAGTARKVGDYPEAKIRVLYKPNVSFLLSLGLIARSETVGFYITGVGIFCLKAIDSRK